MFFRKFINFAFHFNTLSHHIRTLSFLSVHCCHFEITSKMPNNSARTISAGPTHIRLTPESSRRIVVYRNGDPHHKGITIVLNTRQLHDIGALLDAISEKIGLVLGCKRLYSLEGTPISSIDQLEHNKVAYLWDAYVASSGAFTSAPYGRQRSANNLFGARRGSASGGVRSSASKEDSLAQSFASKQSAPASLGVHVPIRQSKSIEPRRTGAVIGGARAMPTVNGTIGRRDRSNSAKTPAGKGRKKSGGDNKREGKMEKKASMKKKGEGKVNAKDSPAAESAPPVPVASTANISPTVEEEKGTEDGREEEQKPAELNRTEVEVVEHSEGEEEKEEEEEEKREEEQRNEEKEGEDEGSNHSQSQPVSQRSEERTETVEEGNTENNERTS